MRVDVRAYGRRVTTWLRGGSGPLAASLFHAMLAICLLAAWLSLAAQLDVLVGSRGLLPAAEMIESLRHVETVGFFDYPTLFWIDASDTVLRAGTWLGTLLAVLALVGIRPRTCLALSAPLYLSYATIGESFTAFQWDSMLVECAILGALLPRDRAAPWAHALVRLLFFKLYFESGIAKLQSHLGDWLDGSAMTYYYETAPLPTWLAWYAHHLPSWWHHVESRATLVMELAVPVLAFGPRRARLAAAIVLTGFQLVNLATANYGFFCYLAIATHAILLDESDLERARALAMRAIDRLRAAIARALSKLRPRASEAPAGQEAIEREPVQARAGDAVTGVRARLVAAKRVAFTTFACVWIVASMLVAIVHLGRSETWRARIAPIVSLYDGLRFANAYHLFGHITRERIEPELQTFDGTSWRAHHFRYKAGPPSRAPAFVAPYHPRVDFRLWFYGLSFRSGVPDYVYRLIERMCLDPRAVQPLFVSRLPRHPRAVRIVMRQYHFTTPEQRRQTGDWWVRELVAALRPVDCRTL